MNRELKARLAELLAKAPADERIAEINRKLDYKYFGDYEMSEDQRQAVDDCQTAMNVLRDMRDAMTAQVDERPTG